VKAPNIIVFDSGLGGLTVYREVAAALPQARYLYVADDAFFPYGSHDETALIARVVELMGELIAAHGPDLVVIACNTASTLVLPHLRERFQVPFIGTVPAIKPACAASVSKRVSVLGTQATVAREYTKARLPRSRRPSCAASASRMPPLRASLAPALSTSTAAGPTRWCSLARTTRCCSTGLPRWRPGRCASSIRPRRSRGGRSS
jgi:glutamate racemase